jgi:radical SAM superfamily enzyme YgiQ (UPF0313 family)
MDIDIFSFNCNERGRFQVSYTLGVLFGTFEREKIQYTPMDIFIEEGSHLGIVHYHDYLNSGILSQSLSSLFKKMSKKIKSEILSFSCLDLDAYTRSIAFAKYVKKNRSNIIIVVGGSFTKYHKIEDVFAFGIVDYLFHGNSEMEFVKLIRQRRIGKVEESSIKNLFYIENGFLKYTGSLTYNINERSGPNFDYYEKKIGRIKAIQYMTSQGCINNCNFCCLVGNDLMILNSNKVMNELNYLQSRYKPDIIEFQDDNIFTSKDRMKELLSIFKKINIKWYSSISPNVLDHVLIDLMIDSGCYSIQIGLESVSKNLLKKMNKNYDVDSISKYIQSLANGGVGVVLNFLVGTPYETPEDARENIDFILKYSKYIGRINLNKYVLLKGSPWGKNLAIKRYARSKLIENNNTYIEYDNQKIYDYYKAIFEKHGINYV